MDKFKILNLTMHSPEFLGGFGESLLELGKYMKAQGSGVIVCFPKFQDWMKIFELAGICVEIIPLNGLIDWRAIRLIYKLIRKHKVYIIHTHFGLETQVNACIVKFLCPWLKVVWHWRNPIRTELPYVNKSNLVFQLKVIIGNLLYRLLDKCFVSLHIVISDSLRDMLLKRKLTDINKIRVIPNGVNLNRISDNRNIRFEIGLSEDTILVGNISNFRPQKDHFTFLESVKIVLNYFPNVKFLLVGNGPTLKQVKAYANKLSITNSLIFTGFQQDVNPFIRACNFTVISSFYEGFGNVICESLALERPVIATSVGGINDIIKDGENGLLVPPRSPKLMAESMLKLIEHPEDIGYLGINGRKVVESKFTTSIWVNSIMNEYYRLIN